VQAVTLFRAGTCSKKKRALYYEKRAQYSEEKVLYSEKRALYLEKRTLYPEEKALYCEKEPYILTKKPYDEAVTETLTSHLRTASSWGSFGQNTWLFWSEYRALFVAPISYVYHETVTSRSRTGVLANTNNVVTLFPTVSFIAW